MHEYLTTKELAELLRIKERKVYDLAASGEVPCTKAMGKLLFSRRAIDAWLAAHSSGASTAAERPGPPPMVFLGSHDPVLDWALREARTGVAAYFDGSADGLRRMLAGEGVAAGLHLYDALQDAWNAPDVAAACADRPFVLVQWARRQRGLLVRRDATPAIERLADLPGRRIAARQPEAGAERLFAHCLSAADVDHAAIDTALVARSEADAARAVANGQADACFGLEALAQAHGLAFHPVAEEQFDVLVDRRAWFEPPLQAFWAFCQSDAFKEHARRTPGFDATGLGRVRWNGP